MHALPIDPEFPETFWSFDHALQLTDDRDLVEMMNFARFNSVFIGTETPDKAVRHQSRSLVAEIERFP